MKLDLTDYQVMTVISALDYFAHMEAGQSQAPDLCAPEDFEEFDLARDIERRLNVSLHLRSLWVLNEKTGEKEMRK